MKMSTIKLSQKTKNKLVNLRLTDAETYENIVIRLINSYMRDKMKIELISKEETSNPYGKKLIIYRYYNEKMNDIIVGFDTDTIMDLMIKVDEEYLRKIRIGTKSSEFNTTYYYIDVTVPKDSTDSENLAVEALSKILKICEGY